MRSFGSVVVCALIACGCKNEWKQTSQLDIQTTATHAAYGAVLELDLVQPKLVVEGEGALRDAVEHKLTAEGAGKDGQVKVRLAMPGSVSGDGTLEVDVQFEGSWGGGPKHHIIGGSITGTITYESGWRSSATLTKAIGEKLANEVLAALAKEKPAHAGPPAPPAPAIAVGRGLHLSCSLHQDGSVRCWGSGASILGPVPFAIANLEGAVEIAVGDDIGCARLRDGGVRCWDAGRWKETDTVYGANPVCGVDHVVALSGGAPTCALEADGRVVCWGAAGFENACAQTDTTVVPKLIATQLATSFFHACAIDPQGQVSCWEPCRDSCRDAKLAPVRYPALDGAKRLAVGAEPCAILANDVVRCAGANQTKAVDVTVPGVVQIASELSRTFAIGKDHQVYTWGKGELTATPDGATKATELSASPDSACIVTDAGGVGCWARDHTFALVGVRGPDDPRTHW